MAAPTITDYRVGQEIEYFRADVMRRDKVWHGRIEYVWVNTGWLKVCLLDEGYEGLPEMVHIEQVLTPEMTLCEHCRSYHSIKALAEGFVCPLAPANSSNTK